ncbi:permease [Leucobacter insecticola]|uniref:Permease n=1 Tax=Leucobacter insecticola TaxID=2714934 RepID=A0A6G8FI55_9MICO|nr:permease [Leucobacter insecticola]QIM16130.1 permease [Leucobacter insecticola]
MSLKLELPFTGKDLRTGQLVWRLAALAAAWVVLYVLNENVWAWLFGDALGLDTGERLWGSIEFFVYDTSKILLLLAGMIFSIGLLRTALRPERIRAWLDGKSLPIALLLAALFGAITPFCSCSSIPLFIGFVAAGVPLSVTLTFLIASPLVNEVAVLMLGNAFGWPVTIAYVLAGLGIAVVIGAILSRFKLDHHVQDFVFGTPTSALHEGGGKITLQQRVDAAAEETRDIFGRVWKWVILGVGVGAVIHGWVPTEFFATYAGPDNPFAVVIATLAGAPLYSNAAGVIPIVEAMYGKGMALGTAMSFMMATVALSLPEFMLLKQVLKPRLLLIFFGSVSIAIMLVGFGFNLFAG